MPDIFDAFVAFKQLIEGYLGLLNNIVFNISGFSVSYGGIVFAVLVVGLVISVFWRGAKT